MLPGLFQSTNIPALAETVNFAQARHGVLIGNLANINTPGYRVRDLSTETFQQKLKEAISAAQTQGEPISPGMSRSQPGDPLREVRQASTNLLYHDDTNLDLEKQVAEISKNQYMHSIALTIMNDQFSLLHAAISEHV